MNANETLVPSGAKIAFAGAAIWLALLAGVQANALRLSIFDLLFLLAPWVAVPLALSLIPTTQASGLSRACGLLLRWSLLPGAALATVSFFLRGTRAAGALVSVWLIVALALAVDGLGRLVRTRLEPLQEFCFAIGEGYALVGALWLLASRLGLQPVGFREPIVLLTAVHFHYAGLVAAILAGLAASETGAPRYPFALRAALTCAVLGPGLLGMAFLVGPKLKLAAVGVMVVGECGLALATFRVGWSAARRAGGRLLLAGSACLTLGMALAGIWAIGEYPLHVFVNLEQMARCHGVLNSFGFGLCSLLGWTLLRQRPRESREQV